MSLLLTPDAVQASLSALPAFPHIVTQVLSTLDDDGSSLSTLVNYLQRDPVIAGRVLAAANASQFGHRALGGVAAAVSFIGMRRIRDIVITTSLLDFSRMSRCPQLFWEHSLAVGIGAQELARDAGLDMDRALVAGLLHDIGKLWMAYLHPQENRQVHEIVRDLQRPLCEVEQDVFGMDHCMIGEIIARHWGLPADLIEAIATHHEPAAEPGAFAALTCVAEAICNGLDLPYRDDNQVNQLSVAALECLHLDVSADVSDLLGRIDARFQHARETVR